MTISHVLLLLLAGLGAGTVNAIAGGGSLITFPALLAIGLPAKAANVTNSIAVFPGYAASVYGSRTDLRELAERRGTAGAVVARADDGGGYGDRVCAAAGHAAGSF